MRKGGREGRREDVKGSDGGKEASQKARKQIDGRENEERDQYMEGG